MCVLNTGVFALENVQGVRKRLLNRGAHLIEVAAVPV